MKYKHGKQTKQTKPLYQVGQVVNKVLPGPTPLDPPLYMPVAVLERKWAGHIYYYRIQYVPGGNISWLLESQLAAPIGEMT